MSREDTSVVGIELLTEREAAAILHISARTLREIRSRGLIRYVRPSPRKVFYRAVDLAEYIERHTFQEEPPQPTFNSPKPSRRTRTAGFMEGYEQRRLKRQAAR